MNPKEIAEKYEKLNIQILEQPVKLVFTEYLKEPATTINAGASSWWGSFTQCGGTPRMMAGCARRSQWQRLWRLQHRLVTTSGESDAT